MKLTQEALKEFEKLIKEDYPNEKFTKEQILEMATRTLRVVELIFKPLPKSKEKEFKKFNNEKGQT
jgi:hypothetical protein